MFHVKQEKTVNTVLITKDEIIYLLDKLTTVYDQLKSIERENQNYGSIQIHEHTIKALEARKQTYNYLYTLLNK